MVTTLFAWVQRIVGIWAVLLSAENAFAVLRRPASQHGWHDWVTGQLVGVPLALALLVPAAFALVMLARLVAARRAYPGASLAAVVAAVAGFALSSGPNVAALERRIPFVLATGAAGFAIAFVLVRKLPLERPRVIAGAGGAFSILAWFADQRVLPGLYPALHVGFIGIALAGSACLALLWSHRPAEVRRPGLALALWAIGVSWGVVSFATLQRDENVRHVLLRDAPVIGRMVFLSSQLPFRAGWNLDAEADELDPQLTSLLATQGVPRTLDWSDCDMLLVTVDTLRPDHLSAYGYERSTSPALEKLVARGARFDRAYSTAPMTSFSLASLMAGRQMRSPMVKGTSDTVKVWADYMRELGYDTMAMYTPLIFSVGGGYLNGPRERGFGFEHPHEEKWDVDRQLTELASYVESTPQSKRMFVWVHVFEPHSPYKMHPTHPFPGGRKVDAYDSEIAVADAFIGKAVELVESRERCSAIIVTADHGEAFGEHGENYHGTHVYEEQVRVPLIIVAPGVVPGVHTKPVQTIDLLPTALSALGAERESSITGRDLGPLLSGKLPDDHHPGLAFAETSRFSMLAVGDERLICDRDAQTCVLYDLAIDPRQYIVMRDRPHRVRKLRALTAAIVELNATGFPLRFAATSAQLRPANATIESGMLTATGEPGTIVFGPYIDLPAGRYELVWTGSGVDSPGELAFSVRADSGAEILAFAQMTGREVKARRGELVRLPFTLDRERSALEFLVETNHGARVMLEQVVVERLGDVTPKRTTSR